MHRFSPRRSAPPQRNSAILISPDVVDLAQFSTTFRCHGSQNRGTISSMNEFTVNTTINAPVDAVWAALADIGDIAAWNPGVQASHTTSAQAEGVGACRHCDLGGKNYLDEEVVTWRENEAITFRIVGTNMPFDSADPQGGDSAPHIRFTLTPIGDQTQVTCSPIYKLKYGVAGTLMDKLFVARTYKSGMEGLLAGLKKHVEKSRLKSLP